MSNDPKETVEQPKVNTENVDCTHEKANVVLLDTMIDDFKSRAIKIFKVHETRYPGCEDTEETATIRLGMRILKRLEKSHWIDVTDELPDRSKYDWVLVKIEFGAPHIAEYINGKWQFQCLDSTDAEKTLAVKVTHWRPIPEDI